MRQHLFSAAIISSALVLFSCKKEQNRCDGLEEAPVNTLTDISLLTANTAFADTLAKYPQLKVFRIIDDEHTLGMHCNVYYEGLPVISDGFNLFQSKSTNEITSLHDYIVDEVNVSLTPTVPLLTVTDIAREQVGIKNRCAYFQLAIFNSNAGKGNLPRDYRLVWNITDQKSDANVIVDAHTQAIYRSFDGKYE